ncbi:hypothetical protein SAMN02745866_02921 [Alteromonadaceae bacterium Bs31]|nr:hypothetical protein SAMN02745866_02921 [Alteromonadaceae bacterium Bs31]
MSSIIDNKPLSFGACVKVGLYQPFCV